MTEIRNASAFKLTPDSMWRQAVSHPSIPPPSIYAIGERINKAENEDAKKIFFDCIRERLERAVESFRTREELSILTKIVLLLLDFSFLVETGYFERFDDILSKFLDRANKAGLKVDYFESLRKTLEEARKKVGGQAEQAAGRAQQAAPDPPAAAGGRGALRLLVRFPSGSADRVRDPAPRRPDERRTGAAAARGQQERIHRVAPQAGALHPQPGDHRCPQPPQMRSSVRRPPHPHPRQFAQRRPGVDEGRQQPVRQSSGAGRRQTLRRTGFPQAGAALAPAEPSHQFYLEALSPKAVFSAKSR